MMELNEASKIISKYLNKINFKAPNAKTTLDVFFSKENYIDVDNSIIKEILLDYEFEEKIMQKNSYRKFQVVFSRNVTTKVDINFFNENTELDFRVDIENTIVNKENLQKEICNSAYYYFVQYYRLHNLMIGKVKN